MSVENVIAFFKRMEEDEIFRNEFVEIERAEKGNIEAILKVAAEKGYAFTMEDLKQAQEEMKEEELSDNQLEKVAGGFCGFHGMRKGCWFFGW